jgi:hypothetical protein
LETTLALQRLPEKTLTFVGVLQLMIYTDKHINVQSNGWMFVATLPSGKCVVSNET